jgi:hypothetical protein
MRVEHLTDEQFAELLAGTTSDRWAELHLENCVECRDELTAVNSAVVDLNVASLRWAERRAVRIETPSKWALNWSVLPGWGATVASVLVLGIALGVTLIIASRARLWCGRWRMRWQLLQMTNWRRTTGC